MEDFVVSIVTSGW